jgi:hypothetical protein
MSNIYGNTAKNIFPGGIVTNGIDALDNSAEIDIENGEIDFLANSVFVNGVPIGNGIQNPLAANLNANQFNISNTNTLSTNRIENNNATSSLTLNTPYATFSGNTRVAGELIVNNGVFIDGTPSQLITRSITILADRHENRKFGGMLNANTIYTDSVFANDNTNANNLVALIRYSADENHTVGARGTDIGFFTTLRGSITPTERLTIDADGITRLTGNFQTSLNTESKTYSENNAEGELVKRKNNTSYYAGQGAGASITTGVGNLLIGTDSGSAITSDIFCLAIGENALQSKLGDFNTAIGVNSQAGISGLSISGGANTSVGFSSMGNITTGANNSCFGTGAGRGFSNTNNNTSIGYFSNTNTTLSQNSVNTVAIGANTITNDVNQIVIGYQATATLPNQCVIGNTDLVQIVPSTLNLCDLGSTTNTFKNIFVNQVNSLTAIGGVYMTTSNATTITATAVETSLLLGSTFLGTLVVPANEFTISSYHLNMAGNFSSANGDTLTIRLKNGGQLASFVIDLTGTANESYELEGDFSIRKLGIAGVAEISSNFDLSYSDTVVFLRGSRTCVVNSTTFDTTISNTLQITAQFGTNNASNSIQTLQAILTKIY